MDTIYTPGDIPYTLPQQKGVFSLKPKPTKERSVMELSLSDVKEEDQGLLSPCGIVCMGCDVFQYESLAAAKKIVAVWQGFNLLDVSNAFGGAFGLTPDEVSKAIELLKKFIEDREKTGPCQGCYKGGGPSELCSIAHCVKAKGYWTCAECSDYDADSITPCPHYDGDAGASPLENKGRTSALVCKRYSNNNLENLKRCREIGYSAFMAEMKEKVANGWRTWQVISDEMLFSQTK